MVVLHNKKSVFYFFCSLFLCLMTILAIADWEDLSVALLWKGKLIWTTHNSGRLAGYPAWTQFDWPSRQHDPRSQHIVWGSFIFAVEDNVIESYSTISELGWDWMPKDGSLGYYHSGEGLLVNRIYPQMASSDLPETWPKRSHSDPSQYDPNGDRWWPGRMIPGSHESDRWKTTAPFAASGRDAFCVFDDKYNKAGKPSLGIEVQEQIYDYGRSYAEDIAFIDYLVINTSDKDIMDAYVGYQLWPYVPGGGHAGDYLVAYDSEYDKDEKPDVIYCYDPEDDGTYPPDDDTGLIWGETLIGMIILKTPLTVYNENGEIEDMGVTDFHFFEAGGFGGPTTNESQWPVICSDPTDPDLAGPPSDFFHDTGTDNRIDNTAWIPVNKPKGTNWAFFVTSGPIDLAAGDSTWFTIGFTAEANSQYFKENVQLIQEMAANNFMGAGPPPSPTLSAVAGDGKVTLFWDASAEYAVDQFTNAKDFEGYKLYRLSQGPYGENDWGQEIINYMGKIVGYVPLFQCDKIDGVKGPDPVPQHQYLGDDSGLQHSFVDTSVVNGVPYTYCITAYDSGDVANDLPSFESAKSNVSDERFVVGVVPQTGAAGLLPGSTPEDTLLMTPGDSTFFVSIDVLDPGSITGHDYEVTFTDYTFLYGDSIYTQGFNLFDKNTGEYVIQHGQLTDISGDNTPVADGLRLNFSGRPPGQEFVRLSNSSVQNGINFPYLYVKRYTKDDFEMTIDFNNPVTLTAFQGFGDATYQVPIRVVNLETGENITPYMKVGDQAAKHAGDGNYNAVDYPPGNWDLNPGGACWNPILDSLLIERGFDAAIVHADRLYLLDSDNKPIFVLYTIHPPDGIAPEDGDRFYFGAKKPFPRDAVFTFSTTEPQQKQVTQEMMNEIRVVPNPYIVRASWDIYKQMGKILFTHLPAVCDIKIFTVSGDLVKTIEHRGITVPHAVQGPGRSFSYTSSGLGYAEWDLINDAQLSIAPGLYIYVVSTPEGTKKVGKFAVIK